MSEVKVGVVGAGQIAYNHIRGINKHPDAECVAVADPSAERVKKIADEFDISKTYSSADELFKNPDIDAVSIAVPNKFHAPLSIAALNAGKHVILDKPFALNIKEAREVAAAAEANGKIFTLGMNQRFTQESQTIKALAERGDLGDIYHGKAAWFRRAGIPKFGTWFTRKSESGGGALLDIGVHLLDLCLYLMDNFEPVCVSASAYTKFGNRGLGEGAWGMSDKGEHFFDVDDFTTAFIKFKNGASVGLDVSWALHQEDPNKVNLQLFGTEGGAIARPSAKLFRYSKEHEGEYEVVEPQGVEIKYPPMERFVNWVDAIVGKDNLCCTVEQALTIQKILDAAYLSSATSKEVRIEDI